MPLPTAIFWNHGLSVRCFGSYRGRESYLPRPSAYLGNFHVRANGYVTMNGVAIVHPEQMMLAVQPISIEALIMRLIYSIERIN